jgi:hypothetical protein
MVSASVHKGIPVVRRGRKATVLFGAGRAAAGVDSTPDWLVVGLWLNNHRYPKEGTYAL